MNLFRFTWKIVVITGILLASTVAKAIPIVSTVDQNIFMQTGDSHSYTHNLLLEGFELGSATSGTIEVQFTDDYDPNTWDWEVILIVVDEFDFDTGGFSVSTTAQSYGSELEVNALAEINASGMLDITVASLWGDFYVDKSELIVYGDDGEVAPVPEPATILLMGTGLLGLVAYSRKRYSKKS